MVWRAGGEDGGFNYDAGVGLLVAGVEALDADGHGDGRVCVGFCMIGVGVFG